MEGMARFQVLWACARPVAEGRESPSGYPERVRWPFAFNRYCSQEPPLRYILLQAAEAHVPA
eukprot:8070828-Prorocentrum_lima.AAC.1